MAHYFTAMVESYFGVGLAEPPDQTSPSLVHMEMSLSTWLSPKALCKSSTSRALLIWGSVGINMTLVFYFIVRSFSSMQANVNSQPPMT
jgi:hypothetical protein